MASDDRLAVLRVRLLDVHRPLLEAERAFLESVQGPLGGSEFLQIAATDPRLAWLAPLSELIVALDEEEPDVDALVARARALVAPPDPGTPFGRRYLSVLQRSPDAVLAHAALVRELGR